MDFVDPFSDIDCVIDQADDWPVIAQSISASVAFAGYHRWEFQTIEQVFSAASDYARVGAESFIVWHEGFDHEHHPKLKIQPLEGEVDALLKAPLRRVGFRDQEAEVNNEDPWQEVFDSLRLNRYSLQYPSEPGAVERVFFPDPRRVQNLLETPEAQREHSQNWLRFDLALLDILMTARSLPASLDYLSALPDFLPTSFLERSKILAVARELYLPTLAFLGGLVYRQRDTVGLRLRLLTRGEKSLLRGGFKSVVPWTFIWSLGTGGDDCCRHEDFKNGIAVVSWRSLNSDTTYSQSKVVELAPVAQIARDAPYKEEPQREVDSSKLLSIPGIVRAGAGVTLRFDHAFLAQLLGRNVQASVGVVDPETLL